jgi:hypothetical protein
MPNDHKIPHRPGWRHRKLGTRWVGRLLPLANRPGPQWRKRRLAAQLGVTLRCGGIEGDAVLIELTIDQRLPPPRLEERGIGIDQDMPSGRFGRAHDLQPLFVDEMRRARWVSKGRGGEQHAGRR